MRSTDLKTTAELAREFGVSERRVDYAIRSYAISPKMKAGIIRLYDLDGALKIRAAIVRISANSNRPEMLHA